MLNRFLHLSLTGLIFLTISCSGRSISSEFNDPLVQTHEDERTSQSLDGTITATLSGSQFDTSSEFLLTIANSTQSPIELFKPAGDSCYAETFWFYAKTGMGWQPIQPVLSFKCSRNPGMDIQNKIPNGLEKEFNAGFLLGSRDLFSRGPASYMLRVRYLNGLQEESFLFTDKFQIGQVISLDKFSIIIENVESNPLEFIITNNSDQILWLSPLCSSTRLASGWMDEEASHLQRLTEENTWSNIPSETDGCSHKTDPIEIEIGETMTINGIKWLQNEDVLLQPGFYRWDIVYYFDLTEFGMRDGYHVFSDVFEHQ